MCGCVSIAPRPAGEAARRRAQPLALQSCVKCAAARLSCLCCFSCTAAGNISRTTQYILAVSTQYILAVSTQYILAVSATPRSIYRQYQPHHAVYTGTVYHTTQYTRALSATPRTIYHTTHSLSVSQSIDHPISSRVRVRVRG